VSAVAEFRHLLRGAGFRRLAASRLLSQLGDGMFQAGLAALLFFNPNERANAAQIAIGFLLLFAPFTLVGPFVGPLIDRWQRQRILLVGNVVRFGIAGLLAYLMASNGPDGLLYAAALLALSINRFLLAALAAAIPMVVEDDDLLTANSILPTLGTLSSLLGGGIGAVVTFFSPGIPDNLRSMAALLASGIVFALSSIVATTIGRRELGPLHPLDSSRLREHLRDLVRGLRTGAAYLARRRTPAHALAIMGAQRFLYGMMFVASIVISRNLLADPADSDAGLAAFARVLVFAAAGFGLAAIVTPLFGARVSRHAWIVVCLLVGGLGQALLAASSAEAALLVAATVVSFAVQGGKIAVDTIVQRDTVDEYRGRAFALYDVSYNVALIAAAGVCAVVLPDAGYSVAVMTVVAACYIILAVAYAVAPREPRPAPTDA
jgi:MFS family permease